jgi:hypothetical protein
VTCYLVVLLTEVRIPLRNISPSSPGRHWSCGMQTPSESLRYPSKHLHPGSVNVSGGAQGGGGKYRAVQVSGGQSILIATYSSLTPHNGGGTGGGSTVKKFHVT